MASGRSTNQVIPLFPEGYLQALNAGKELAEQEKWEQAIACYRDAIELNPNGADVYHCLGDAAVKLSRVQEAIAAYQKAVDLKPDWGEVYQKLAQLLRDKNYRCEEISSPRRRLRKTAIDPALPHYNLGSALAKQEDFAGAVEAYKKAIAVNPNLARAHHGLGEALSRLERWEEAVEAYRSAIGLEPDFSWSHNSLGDALSRLERWEEAVEAYRSAIG
ncbi:MAG: tetratricopeptide repeat protein, partial [Limnospira sp.]